MKKHIAFLLTALILCSALLFGCSKKVDYSKYPFTGVFWKRRTEYDEETIHFDPDGTFGYSCACGNPVNDSDLCEGYTYDDKTKTITLKCSEKTDEMITIIKIVKCDENSLHLDFNGEIRIFTKELTSEE